MQSENVEEAIQKWINNKQKAHQSLQTLTTNRIQTLFQILPTRSRDAWASQDLSLNSPKVGQPAPLGAHLSLPDKFDNAIPRSSGIPSWHAPPEPFIYRRWVGGSFIVSRRSPPMVGMNFIAKTLSLESKSLKKNSVTGEEVIQMRQASRLSQWFPYNTEFVMEERDIQYSTQSYKHDTINILPCIPDAEARIHTLKFTPTPQMLTKFCSLQEETFRIHTDHAYTRAQGYPGLVVPVFLELAILMDAVNACTPDDMVCQAVDYFVVNPLFQEEPVDVFRHWMTGNDNSYLPSTIAELVAQAAPPVLLVPTSKRKKKKRPKRVKTDEPPSKIIRPKRVRRRGLFWTETNQGKVGMVALVLLVDKEPPTWVLHPHRRYVFQNGVEPLERESSDDSLYDVGSYREEYGAVDIGEPDFDPLGRPVPSHRGSSGSNLRGSIGDSVARQKQAEAVAHSRTLLDQLFDNDGNR